MVLHQMLCILNEVLQVYDVGASADDGQLLSISRSSQLAAAVLAAKYGSISFSMPHVSPQSSTGLHKRGAPPSEDALLELSWDLASAFWVLQTPVAWH